MTIAEDFDIWWKVIDDDDDNDDIVCLSSDEEDINSMFTSDIDVISLEVRFNIFARGIAICM